MLELLVVGAWLCLIAYGAWFFLSAKEHVPLSPEDISFLWKVHKHEDRCHSTKVEELKRRGKIIGFECGCGYKLVSQRLITQTPYARISCLKREEVSDPEKWMEFEKLFNARAVDEG